MNPVQTENNTFQLTLSIPNLVLTLSTRQHRPPGKRRGCLRIQSSELHHVLFDFNHNDGSTLAGDERRHPFNLFDAKAGPVFRVDSWPKIPFPLDTRTPPLYTRSVRPSLSKQEGQIPRLAAFAWLGTESSTTLVRTPASFPPCRPYFRPDEPASSVLHYPTNIGVGENGSTIENDHTIREGGMVLPAISPRWDAITTPPGLDRVYEYNIAAYQPAYHDQSCLCLLTSQSVMDPMNGITSFQHVWHRNLRRKATGLFRKLLRRGQAEQRIRPSYPFAPPFQYTVSSAALEVLRDTKGSNISLEAPSANHPPPPLQNLVYQPLYPSKHGLSFTPMPPQHASQRLAASIEEQNDIALSSESPLVVNTTIANNLPMLWTWDFDITD
ncbi:hypothetical protein SODALDRAFT_381033 [Sodiomyces alkalinus F11]|uniref:Uncharacterized protein n=1 Tax=Sodiomyces alkalinus (strain CBS 110278 / VKM F-3762 / F11) TaxID=1314773 RepID=A0A3N2PMI9_SODAK|nr:hypothetical protein SODALDRAFT_381033 [Sodiomyces alkalinus F11]ROT35738.1 hypothetical protein SODALDRAFT_381033 [Sodiomyces alkalinus F11]